MKTLGIIGGLGPETGCKFYMSINNKFREIKNCQPNLLLENLPVSLKAEKEIIEGNLGKEHEQLLHQSVKKMNSAGADFLAIPCNTVHVFMEELRKKSRIPILSIIEETAKQCKKLKVNKIGLLASSKTIKEKLYEKALQNQGIEIIIPNKQQQKRINEIIIKIISNQATKEDKEFLLTLIRKFKLLGAEAAILGCTDLPMLTTQEESPLPIINSLECLQQAAVKLLLTNNNNRRL